MKGKVSLRLVDYLIPHKHHFTDSRVWIKTNHRSACISADVVVGRVFMESSRYMSPLYASRTTENPKGNSSNPTPLRPAATARG